jgi:5-methylcytosine-specific restriction endonuclease McrA
MTKQERDARHALKLKLAIIAFLGGKCARCGVQDPRVLTLDHVHGGGRRDHAKRGTHGIRRDILKGARDASDFQILCANCHLIKTFHEG